MYRFVAINELCNLCRDQIFFFADFHLENSRVSEEHNDATKWRQKASSYQTRAKKKYAKNENAQSELA